LDLDFEVENSSIHAEEADVKHLLSIHPILHTYRRP